MFICLATVCHWVIYWEVPIIKKFRYSCMIQNSENTHTYLLATKSNGMQIPLVCLQYSRIAYKSKSGSIYLPNERSTDTKIFLFIILCMQRIISFFKVPLRGYYQQWHNWYLCTCSLFCLLSESPFITSRPYHPQSKRINNIYLPYKPNIFIYINNTTYLLFLLQKNHWF